jgi:drug/metabolite transporter (DMT)-like permease
MTASAPASARRFWQAGTPGLFVFLWSTGFIFAKLGLPYAEAFTFLTLRFGIVTALMLVVALATRAPWPRGVGQMGHIFVVGVLMHGAYLGGTFAAIGAGVSAGVAALVVGLQPLLTAAVVGPFLGERVSARQWIGLVLGFGGVALVLENKIGLGEAPLWGYGFSFLSLLGITIATLYQKRFCSTMDWRSGGVIQYFAATLSMLPAALLFETRAVHWTGEFVLAMLWLVVMLSFGAVTLLNWLIRRGAAARVASLFYLVPPVVAVEAYVIFGEELHALALAGMALTALGVALVMRR